MFIIFISLVMLITSHGDLFETVDSNHDGSIDKEEFNAQLIRLRNVLEPYLDIHIEEDHKHDFSAHDIISDLFETGKNFVSGFVNSLIVILITEIGDKTFFIAAVLAMRNARLAVYLGAMTALAAMHILSSLMGFALPALLPRTYTHLASIGLFIYFGIKLLKESYEMKTEGPSDELHEVEEELIMKKSGDDNSVNADIHVEEGNNSSSSSNSKSQSNTSIEVFTQALTLTFLAEWGDRSQIATIALAASKNIVGVILGGLLGHAFCTGVAVIGGRLLAAKISEKAVATIGGILFLVFAFHSFITGSDI
jgi:putative Ca2+/H+ antiporter (TMEM165/GDT1 family)